MVVENVIINISARGARATSRNIRNVGRTSRSAARSVTRLGGALAVLGGAAASGGLIGLADAATNLQNRIRTTTKSAGEMNAVLEELRRVSFTTRSSIGDNARIFQRFSNATEELGTSQADVITVVEGLNAAMAVSGTEASEAAAGLLQLSQGIASDKFAGDELKSVLENLPELGKKFSKELRVSVAELRDMGEAGELNVETVWPALLAAAKGFKEELADIEFTVANTFKVLQTEALLGVGAINRVISGSKNLNQGILTAAKSVGVILVKAFSNFVKLGAEAVDASAGFLDVLAEIGITVPSLGSVLGIVGKSFVLFFKVVSAGFQGLRTSIATLKVGIISIANAISSTFGGATTDNTENIKAMKEAMDDAAKAAEDASFAMFEFGSEVFDAFANGQDATQAADNARRFANELRGIGVELDDIASDNKISISEVTGATGSADLTQKRPPGASSKKKVEREISDLSQIFVDTFSAGLAGIARGEGFDFFEAMAGVGSQLVQKGLEDAFTVVMDTFEDLMGAALENVDFSGLGEGFGAAMSAGLGIALALISSSFGGTKSSVRNDLVSSAVESAQATRGVVAGPVDIPVFKVGAEIEKAFLETNSILRQILGAVQTSGVLGQLAELGPAVAFGPGDMLTGSTPSLIG